MAQSCILLDTDEAAPALVKLVDTPTAPVTSHVNMFGPIVDPCVIPGIRAEAALAGVTAMNVDRPRHRGIETLPLVATAVQRILDHEGWSSHCHPRLCPHDTVIAENDAEGVAKMVLVNAFSNFRLSMNAKSGTLTSQRDQHRHPMCIASPNPARPFQ